MTDDMKKMNSYHMGKCIPQETTIKDVRLARAYVPFQKMCSIFSPMEALKRGTAFPELFSPYDKKDKKYKSTEKYR
jgi:hypothetical protein